MPRVSVIIASFNHERFVQEAVHSILSQDFDDFELIITDDGSSDDSIAQIKKMKDQRLTLFCFENNRGACAALNHCIAHARGQYIAVMNSDDVCCEGRLRKQVAFLDNHPEIGTVFGQPQIIDEAGNQVQNRLHNATRKMFSQSNRNRFEWLNHFFYESNCLCHPSVMIRKQCYDDVGLYDQRYAQLPDFDFWIRLCLKYEIHILPDHLVKFRVFTDMQNASGTTPEKMIRLQWERRHILENYLNIRDKETLLQIFPEAAEFGDHYSDTLIPFIIANLALKLRSDYTFARAFALDTLGKLLKNPEVADEIQRTFGFTCRDFIRMTGQYDIFNHELNNKIKKIRKHPIKFLLGFDRAK